MSKKIDSKLTPREVDNFLQENYFLSLYHFAFSLDDLFSLKDYKRIKIKEHAGIETPWRDFWNDRIQELEKIKRNIKDSKKTLDNFLYKTDKFLKSFFDPNLQVWAFTGKNLFINDISPAIDDIINYIKEFYSYPKNKGVSPENINLLFLVWANFIKNKNECHINTLLSLLDWFSLRIGKSDIRKKDKKEEIIRFDEQYKKFSKELYRYRRGELKSLIHIVEGFKKRFLVPVRHEWLELTINTLKKIYGPMKPLIIFSNGEKLTPKDCLENNPSYSEFLLDDYSMFSQVLDFIYFKYDNSTILFDNGEFEDDEPDIITKTLIFEKNCEPF